MKKKVMYFFVFLLLTGLIGCSGDDLEPRFPKHIILKATNQKVLDVDQYTEIHRENVDPTAYQVIADYVANEIAIVLTNELKPDTGISNGGSIAEVIYFYTSYQWDHPKVKKSKIWEKIKIGIDKDLYRTCPDYCEYLAGKIREYIETIVTGNPEWTTGVRENWREEQIKNSIYDINPKNEWQMSFYQELVAYYKSFAENPKNKGKVKGKDGWFIFNGYNY